MEPSSNGDPTVVFIEKFRYKVVYPGGVHVRISPAVDADRTGVVLQYGDVFEAIKSSMLDGINFVKLIDGSGWVFGNKGDTEILELLEVVRVPTKSRRKPLRSISEADFTPTTPPTATNSSNGVVGGFESQAAAGNAASAMASTTSSTSFAGSLSTTFAAERINTSSIKSFHSARSLQKYWRDIKAKVSANCNTFNDFCNLANSSEMNSLSQLIKEDQKLEKQRNLIKFVATVTKQIIPEIDDVKLAHCLLLFVNLGFKVSRFVLTLIIDEANIKFEKLPVENSRYLIETITEISERTKMQRTEIGKLADILSDDIKNFHQRWILIKASDMYMSSNNNSMKAFLSMPSTTVDSAANAIVSNEIGEISKESRLDSVDTAAVGTEDCEAGSTVESNPLIFDGNGVVGTAAPAKGSIASTPSNSNNTNSSLALSTNSWFTSWICKSVRTDVSADPNYSLQAQKLTENIDNAFQQAPKAIAEEQQTFLESMKNRLWIEVEKKVKTISNPDVQFAGLI